MTRFLELVSVLIPLSVNHTCAFVAPLVTADDLHAICFSPGPGRIHGLTCHRKCFDCQSLVCSLLGPPFHQRTFWSLKGWWKETRLIPWGAKAVFQLECYVRDILPFSCMSTYLNSYCRQCN